MVDNTAKQPVILSILKLTWLSRILTGTKYGSVKLVDEI